MDLKLPECTKNTKQGSICQLLVDKLSPTQCGVGMLEIDVKVAKIKAKNAKQLKDYLFSRPVPIIVGPGGAFYLTDHHHLAFSLWRAAKEGADSGIKCSKVRVVVEVMANWRDYESEYQFWKRMQKESKVYLYDQNGGGPIQPKKLAKHVKDLKDDMYRSLSWKMREENVYVKDPANPLFAEFVWADFFRKHLVLDKKVLKNSLDGKPAKFDDHCIKLEQVCCEGKFDKTSKKDQKLKAECEDFRDLLNEAKALAISKAARGLPGYTGNQ